MRSSEQIRMLLLQPQEADGQVTGVEKTARACMDRALIEQFPHCGYVVPTARVGPQIDGCDCPVRPVDTDEAMPERVDSHGVRSDISLIQESRQSCYTAIEQRVGIESVAAVRCGVGRVPDLGAESLNVPASRIKEQAAH